MMASENGDALLEARDRARNRQNFIIGIAAAVLTVIGILLLIYTVGGKDEAENQRNSAAGQVVSLADQIQRECAIGRLSGPICENAARAKVDPVPGPDGSSPVVTPTTEEIATAVSAYLVANPPAAGPGPTQAQIAAAVTTYLVMNPPADGRPPTEREVRDAVNSYIELNPPADGEPGRPPTAEEIAAAVATYLQANPPARGPEGPQGDQGLGGPPGPQGIGVQSVADPARNPNTGACQVVFTLTDQTLQPIDVPENFCGPPLVDGT